VAIQIGELGASRGPDPPHPSTVNHDPDSVGEHAERSANRRIPLVGALSRTWGRSLLVETRRRVQDGTASSPAPLRWLDGMPDINRPTLLLQRLNDGDSAASEELLKIVYAELHGLARRAMAREPGGHTLQPTALLNEAWMRLFDSASSDWQGHSHFLGVAARAMRSILVDHARRRGAEKRGGDRVRMDLSEAVASFEERGTDLVVLDEALEELAEVDPELARIVELRFFGGLKHPEIAKVLDSSLRSVERGWSTARAWLYQRVGDPTAD
jgi:RNA polymerase sigma-70 factor (ECF subfamily)